MARRSRIATAGLVSAAALFFALRLEDHARLASLDPGIRGWAILPPLLAILLAFTTRRILPSLGVAIALGAFLASELDPLEAAARISGDYAASIALDPSKLWIIVFTVALVGTVSLVSAAGGVRALVSRLMRLARGPRSAQFATFLAGLIAFFDDYTNAILVGTSMRPLFDRLRLSREKLAYLVDSTSAPIAGVAVISTWIGYEVGLFDDVARGLGLGASGYEIFFRALPFRFYCYFALLFLLLNVLSGREFGPMLEAEESAARSKPPAPESEEPATSVTSSWVAILPIGLVLASTLLGLLWDGGGLSGELGSLYSLSTWREVFGVADSTRVLGIASLLGTAFAFALVLGKGCLSLGEAGRAFLEGARSMGPALGILLLAWGMKAVCDDLGTSDLLVAALSESIAPTLLPIATFLLASAIAFATGTSWGAMGILIPSLLPLAHLSGGMEILLLCAAAILDGAIFGDHVSPLSDTTVLSSISSGADLMEHVRTQIPYALAALFAALLFGYGFVAAGLPYPLSWLLGTGAMAAALFGLGRKPQRASAVSPASSQAA